VTVTAWRVEEAVALWLPVHHVGQFGERDVHLGLHRSRNNRLLCLDAIGTPVATPGLGRCGTSFVNSLTRRIAVAKTNAISGRTRRGHAIDRCNHMQTQIFGNVLSASHAGFQSSQLG
jgi:hypothetical protein